MALDEIKLEGRMDYVKGLGIHQNPYYLRERMPRATGEDFQLWHQKIDAWEEGWSEAGCEQQALNKVPSNAASERSIGYR